MQLATGFIGVPPVNGVLPQAPMHTKSLVTLKQLLVERDAPRKMELKKKTDANGDDTSDLNCVNSPMQTELNAHGAHKPAAAAGAGAVHDGDGANGDAARTASGESTSDGAGLPDGRRFEKVCATFH